MTYKARRFATLIFAATVGITMLTAAAAGPAGAARAPASPGGWGPAMELPGLTALSPSGNGGIMSVSCASAGNCGAGGYYLVAAGQYQAFVVNQANGTWQNAEEVPGTAALNAGDAAETTAVSCASAGNCSAGGFYRNAAGKDQLFVVGETNGTWQNAQEVPGTATLNHGNAFMDSVSCASAGNCSASGVYVDRHGHHQALVVNETNGTWQNAEEVPGTATLNQGGSASLGEVSCTSVGKCSAGGSYRDASRHFQAFVVNETNGTWHKAEEVAAALNLGGDAELGPVSCASAGNCSAGGYYQDGSRLTQAFVVNETNGTWQNAEEVPGTATLNQTGDAELGSVSCASVGNCSAGGYYWDGRRAFQAFVVNETNGTWQNAEEVPGTATLNKGGMADIMAVSCTSAGNCSAGGYYQDTSSTSQALVVNEVNGTWQKAGEVPGTAGLNQSGNAYLGWVSCTSAGMCSGAGGYRDGSGDHVFVVSRT